MSNMQRRTLDDMFVAPTHEPAAAETPKVTAGKRDASQEIATTLRLPAPVHKLLSALAFDEGRKLHPLYLEAVDLLLHHRGLPSIAELKQSVDGK